GLLCPYAPEEVIYAAGMLPWRVSGTWTADISRASVYRDLDSCRYCTHALEGMLRGEMEFLDGIVASDWDDDRRRLYDIWRFVGKPAFSFIYTVPKNKTEIAERYFAKDISRLASGLEKFGEVKITDEKLRQAIEVHNRTRSLLMQLYELRKRPVPAITGAEALGIVTAAMVMDKVKFNAELEALLPYIEKRQTGRGESQPRILVSSDMLDNPQFLEMIEGEGCNVVMDDLDTGSRYFHGLVDPYAADAVAAISRRYCWKPADPIAFNWPAQAAQTIAWAKEFRADGVIELFEAFSPARQWRAPLVTRLMSKADMPFAKISRSYDLSGVEQIRTRVGAFLEMISLPV
ncbi:MAG: 2-hydroxyacyl-CoA dehydratase, partial [Chloroflexi bacterium]|nr:2-hydroxyacyl-CoA dehydratase [Chloroflexota bacterium]